MSLEMSLSFSVCVSLSLFSWFCGFRPSWLNKRLLPVKVNYNFGKLSVWRLRCWSSSWNVVTNKAWTELCLVNRSTHNLKCIPRRGSAKWSLRIEMEFLGMDFSCALGSLSAGKFPEKDCLLPLISKLLGYCIVAASTTVKVPQVNK